MNANRSRLIRIVSAATLVVALSGLIAYAATTIFRFDARADHIAVWDGASQVTARSLVTPKGEITGTWHYHPGYVYNVVVAGTVTIEDGCGEIHQYSQGEAFETSEGRVHRAYNLGSVDAEERNMFVGPPDRPITVNIPNNEHRCGPPSRVDECRNGGWMQFNHPAPFDNQGACIAYVNHRRRVTVLVPEDPLR